MKKIAFLLAAATLIACSDSENVAKVDDVLALENSSSSVDELSSTTGKSPLSSAESKALSSSDPLPEGYREHVCKKGFRGKPLTAFQEKCNAKKSRTRCRIEHVFGWVKGNHELFVRTIGKARAKAKILASFITYNMFRMVAITRPKWA